MKNGIIIITIILLSSCNIHKRLGSKPEIIAYRFPEKIETLLMVEIEKKDKGDYCILVEQKEGNSKEITLVNGYSYYHKITSYKALIGNSYYPISFPQFDIKYGVVENAKKLLKRKISKGESEDFLTKQSYPLYHGVYRIEVDSNDNIVSEGVYLLSFVK